MPLKLLLFLALLQTQTGPNVTIAWDASVSTDVVGYKVYFGREAGVYNTPTTIGNVLTYTLVGLAPGTWYITVTAFNADGLESDYATAADDPTRHYVIAVVPAASCSCDINGDGQVNIVDIQLLANAILGVGTVQCGDLNGDGQTNIVDLQKLVNVVLGTAQCK